MDRSCCSLLTKSLRREIQHLNYDACKELLAGSKIPKESSCKRHSPIFVFICQEKARWKDISVQLNMSTTETLDVSEIENCLNSGDKDLKRKLFSGNLSKIPEFISKLEKIFILRVFEKIISLLVEFGFDVNEQDLKGWTALHYSIKFGLIHITRILIDSGVSLQLEARISSWVSKKLPALYHCLYWLDLDAARMVISSDYELIPDQIDNCADFMFLPSSIPVEIQNCLLKIQHINPLTFLLFVFVIKAYGDPCLTTLKVEKLVNVAADFGLFFQDLDNSHIAAPEFLINFHKNSEKSLTSNGYCKGRFFFQVVRALFNIY